MTSLNDTRAEAWIPHRGAMRLIDRIVEADDDHAVAELEVPFDGLFVRKGGVPGWVGIEYMAQTISAWDGARARRAGGAPRLGLLLGSRRYEAHCAGFPAAATLRIEARCDIMTAEGMGLFDCTIHMNAAEVARGRISVFAPADDAALQRAGALS